MLVGNKTDLGDNQRKVSTSAGQQLADEEGIAFVETSAKAPTNVASAFNDMAKEIKGKLSSSAQRQSVNVIRPSTGRSKRPRCTVG